jgi:hypothetical protein
VPLQPPPLQPVPLPHRYDNGYATAGIPLALPEQSAAVGAMRDQSRGNALSLPAKTKALLYNPIAAYAVSLVAVWLVAFLGLLIAKPGFVTRAVIKEDGTVQHKFMAGKAAGIAAAVSALAMIIPAVVSAVRRRRAAKQGPVLALQ